MSKKPSKKSERPRDPNTTAFSIGQAISGELPPVESLPDGKNAAAVALGRLGGAKAR
jgi:hypothetical protein